MSTASRTDRPPLPALTGLRFVAAFSVLVGHAAGWLANFPPEVTWIHYITQATGIGMPLFFVLSGFVIHYNYGHYFQRNFYDAFVRFMIARVARLYPLYILLLAVYVIDHRMFSAAPTIWLKFLTLSQSWHLSYEGTAWVGHHFLAPAWSVSVEMFMYITYALAGVVFLRLVQIRSCLIAFVLIWAAYYGFIYICATNAADLQTWGNNAFYVNANPQNALLGWVFNTGPIGRLFEFCMGATAAQLFLRTHNIPVTLKESRLMSVLLYLTLALLVAIYIGARHYYLLAFGFHMAGEMAPFFAFIIFCSARYQFSFVRVMQWKWFVLLGEASYSIYLIHEFTLRRAAHALHLDMPAAAVNAASIGHWLLGMALGMAFTLMWALLTYFFYEVPSRRFVRTHLMTVWNYIRSRWPQRFDHPTGGRARLIFLSLWVAGFCWLNWPYPPAQIEISEASYGANCANYKVKAPGANSFKPGNATFFAIQACRSNKVCNIPVDVLKLGDPASGCGKNFVLKYTCRGDKAPRQAILEPEAHGKVLHVECK